MSDFSFTILQRDVNTHSSPKGMEAIDVDVISRSEVIGGVIDSRRIIERVRDTVAVYGTPGIHGLRYTATACYTGHR